MSKILVAVVCDNEEQAQLFWNSSPPNALFTALHFDPTSKESVVSLGTAIGYALLRAMHPVGSICFVPTLVTKDDK